jgi:Lrp/AsnC family transcriptional regulator for asnA, asnC and gidA
LSKFDSLDRIILALLNQNARLSSATVARQVGVSERTVSNRIKRLVALDAIQPTAVVDPLVFGYTLAVDIFCELEVGHQEQAIQALLKFPEVSYIAISTGDHDLNLRALFKDSDAMQAFITHKLHQLPGMRRARPVLIPRIIKDSHQWLPPDDSFSLSDETDSPGQNWPDRLGE